MPPEFIVDYFKIFCIFSLLVPILVLIMFNDDFLVLTISLLLFFGSGLYMLSYYKKIVVGGVSLFPADFIAIILLIRLCKDTVTVFIHNAMIDRNTFLLYVIALVYIAYVTIIIWRQSYLIGDFKSFKIIAYEGLYICMLLAFATYIKSIRHIRIMTDVIVYGSLVLGILLLIDNYNAIFSFQGMRITTTHKGFLFLLPILIALIERKKYLYVQYPLLIIASIHLLITTKRSLFMGIFLAVCYLLLTYRQYINYKKIALAGIGLIIVGICLKDFYWYYGHFLYDRFLELSDIQTGTAGRRLGAWVQAFHIFTASPLFGNAFGLYFAGSESLLKTMHNVFFEKLVMQGILGFMLWVMVIFFALKRKRKSWLVPAVCDFNNIIVAMLIFSIPVMSVNTAWISIYPFTYLGIYFSLHNRHAFLE